MHYTCFSCGGQYPLTDRRFRCDCGGFLTVEPSEFFTREALAERGFSIWRYREAFGLPDEAEPVSLGEGLTPLVRARSPGKTWRSSLITSNHPVPSRIAARAS